MLTKRDLGSVSDEMCSATHSTKLQSLLLKEKQATRK